MSKTLNRLRKLIDDELFVRSSHGLSPTPKSLELKQPVDDILNQLTELMVSIKNLILSIRQPQFQSPRSALRQLSVYPCFLTVCEKRLQTHAFESKFR